MGVKEQQLGFSNWERGRVRKQTRKEKFLCEMEAVLPFSALGSGLINMRNDPLTREGPPREHQEEMGDGPVVGAQRGAGCPHPPLDSQGTGVGGWMTGRC